MDWEAGDPSVALTIFKQKCELYFSVKDIKTEKQVDHILLFAGEPGLRFFNSWGLQGADAKDPKVVWEKFQTQIEPKTNFRVARLFLQRMKQEQNESFDDFISRCKLQAHKCNFRDDTEFNERIIEQAITGTCHPEVQKELLGKDKTLNLDKVLDVGRTYEASLQHMQQLKSVQVPDGQAVHYVQRKSADKKCHRCGRQAHKQQDCPALGTTCSTCGKKNHWSTVCRYSQDASTPQLSRDSKFQKPKFQGYQNQRKKSNQPFHPRRQNRSVHEVTQEEFSQLTLDAVEISTMSSLKEDVRDEIFTYLETKVEKQKLLVNLRVKVDTGAQGNTLPIRMYRQMFPNDLTPEGLPLPGDLKQKDVVLTAYNGTTIKQHGSVQLPCRYGSSGWIPTKFFVVESEGPAIVGLPSSRKMRLVTLNCAIETSNPTQVNTTEDLMKMYPEQFDRVGKFPGKYHIQLKDNVEPVIHAQRKFSIHLREQLKEQLQEMETKGIITKVQEPTDWVSSMVVTRKGDGTLRVCLDPKDLNKAIKRCHHKTPTLEELTHKMAGAKVFSKLDAKNGYWSVELDEASSLLTTFNTPFGRFRYLRMPFGLRMSQDVFQRKMDQILEECPGTMGIADDVAVFGKTEEEHDANLHHLFRVAEKQGLTFNSQKCAIKQPSIKFYGITYDRNGAHPDPDKVADIKRMATPTNQKELQQFLGVVTYMSPFMPKLSSATEPLRGLLKKDAEFHWSASHDEAFTKVKDLICHETTLAYFDPKKPTRVQVDASQKGLGAALLQDGKPIAFASKSLSEAEQRYANIERELLAVVFGCERFHTYLFGRDFIVESDHKPLEMIQLKNLRAAPPRLQRMLMRLQNYDLQILYKPGKDMILPDGLSRLPQADDSHIELNLQIHLVQFGAGKLKELKEETGRDSTLTELREVIVAGWPDSRKGLSPPLRPYWAYRDELAVEDGLILKGERVIIPQKMRKDILKKIHEGHQGQVKCKLRAKECVYWPDITKNIEEETARCSTCQANARSQSKEPMELMELPTRPWQIIGTDLFYLDSQTYLAVADYFSKFPIIKRMPEHCTSKAVINALKEIFAEYGIPDVIRSDNGPQYDCQAFVSFTKEWGIEHVTSSPHFPQSNGFIERTIQTLKQVIKKARESDSDVHMALLTLRTTPIDNHLPSPAEILQGRKVRGNLPVKSRLRKEHADILPRLAERQGVQQAYHDRHATELPTLSPGQLIRVQHPQSGRWEPATVVSQRPEPRAYNIRTDSGAVYRRNRRHLRSFSPSPTRVEDTTPARTEPATISLPAQAANNQDQATTNLTPQTGNTEVPGTAGVPTAQPQDTSTSRSRSSAKGSRDAVAPAEQPRGAATTRVGRTVKVPDRLNL